MSNTSRLQELTPHAEIVSSSAARQVNVAAATGLKSVLQSNLGPYGTIKLLVGGAPGQLKCTKDGLVLLKEMQIQHPTACMIARTATAQDDVTGDGTTSTVLLCAALLEKANTYINEGLHPRLIVDGLEIARDHVLEFLKHGGKPPTKKDDNTTDEKKKGPFLFPVRNDGASSSSSSPYSRELLYRVALTSLRTKLDSGPAEKLADAVVDAMMCILEHDKKGTTTTTNGSSARDTVKPLDLNRIEIMTLPHSTVLPSEEGKDGEGTLDVHAAGGRFINGIVMDHGGRHPNMPKVLKNCKIMTCNISLEYEKTEIASGFAYSNAEEREKLVESERKWLDERCQQIIQFKQKVCSARKKNGKEEEEYNFCIINQKGVDPLSLDIFARHNILCLRRAKRRNMERLTLACGGSPILSLEDISMDDDADDDDDIENDQDNVNKSDPSSEKDTSDDNDIIATGESMLGYAGKVSEMTFGDEKYTFVEDCLHPRSCTILLQGPNTLIIQQMKDAIRDGLRAVKNAIEDNYLIPGAGSFELAASLYLKNDVLPQIKGTKSKIGIQVFADALLTIPKTLALNSGLDIQETMLLLEETAADNDLTLPIGLNCITGEPMIPSDEGIWDNIRVKRQCLYLSTVLSSQLLLVDEVMRAGKQMGNKAQQAQQAQQMMGE